MNRAWQSSTPHLADALCRSVVRIIAACALGPRCLPKHLQHQPAFASPLRYIVIESASQMLHTP